MPLDMNTGIPFLPEEEPGPDGARRSEDTARRLLFLGGAMNIMGSMGPVYPLLLDPRGDGEEEDPNP